MVGISIGYSVGITIGSSVGYSVGVSSSIGQTMPELETRRSTPSIHSRTIAPKSIANSISPSMNP